MGLFDTIFADVQFRLSILTIVDLVDLALVTLVYFGLLQLVRRSQAAALLRIVLFAVFLLLLTNLLLPLPTFDWIVVIAIISLIIATPIAMQPEIQQWLDRIGRNQFRRKTTPQMAELVATPVRRAMQQMSESRTGALMVIEGRESLSRIIETGVPIKAELTEELLRTLFYDKSPLHDGAVILRNNQVVAAGCVLPLSDRELISHRRLGTRHRAAVGLSEVSDAIVFVVSEETGRMARARDGELKTALDEAAVQQQIIEFYSNEGRKSAETKRTPLQLIEEFGASFVYVLLAFFFAILTWALVMDRTNPIDSAEFTNVPLRISGLSDTIQLQTAPPEFVTVRLRSTASVLAEVNSDSFVASVSLADLESGLQRVPITLETNVSPVQEPRAVPASLDLELVPLLNKRVDVQIEIEDTDQLPLGYELTGGMFAAPESSVVSGLRSNVERVVAMRARVSIAGATSLVRRTLDWVPIDADGIPVENVVILPQQTQVTVPIVQRFATRTVGVRVPLSGILPEEYALRQMVITPTVVTLRGENLELADISSFINTVPVDIGQARDTFSSMVPLDLPDGVTALDANGQAIQIVEVRAEIAPLQGEIRVEGTVGMLNVPDSSSVTLEPNKISMLVSGPLPTLNRIADDPDLIALRIDLADVPVGVQTEVMPTVVAPENVTVQLVTPTVIVLIELDG